MTSPASPACWSVPREGGGEALRRAKKDPLRVCERMAISRRMRGEEPDGQDEEPPSEARKLLEALSSPSASALLLDVLLPPAEQRALDEELAAVEAELAIASGNERD